MVTGVPGMSRLQVGLWTAGPAVLPFPSHQRRWLPRGEVMTFGHTFGVAFQAGAQTPLWIAWRLELQPLQLHRLQPVSGSPGSQGDCCCFPSRWLQASASSGHHIGNAR